MAPVSGLQISPISSPGFVVHPQSSEPLLPGSVADSVTSWIALSSVASAAGLPPTPAGACPAPQSGTSGMFAYTTAFRPIPKLEWYAQKVSLVNVQAVLSLSWQLSTPIGVNNRY